MSSAEIPSHEPAVTFAWAEVDATTAAIKAKQLELDALYVRRVNAYRTLTGAGVTIAAIARRLQCNPRGIKLAMEAKRSAGL